jgi:hypothetical protein
MQIPACKVENGRWGVYKASSCECKKLALYAHLDGKHGSPTPGFSESTYMDNLALWFEMMCN